MLEGVFFPGVLAASWTCLCEQVTVREIFFFASLYLLVVKILSVPPRTEMRTVSGWVLLSL